MRTPATIRRTVYFLRFIAICQLLAFIAVFLPVRVWLTRWYAWLGLGTAPEVSAVLHYVVGGTAFFQGAIGVWLWMMVSDVERYHRLLIATAAIYFVAVPVFYFIDARAGLPLWWRMYDCVWCFVVGTALVIVCRQSRSNESLA
jgi:hypothetical protein